MPHAGAPALPFSLDVGGLDYANLAAGFSCKEQTHPADANVWRWTGADCTTCACPGPTRPRAGGLTLTLRLSAGPPERAVPSAQRRPAGSRPPPTVPGSPACCLLPAPAQVTMAAVGGAWAA